MNHCGYPNCALCNDLMIPKGSRVVSRKVKPGERYLYGGYVHTWKLNRSSEVEMLVLEPLETYATLVDKKYTHGLTPGEHIEQERIAKALDDADRKLYDPIKQALVKERDALPKPKQLGAKCTTCGVYYDSKRVDTLCPLCGGSIQPKRKLCVVVWEIRESVGQNDIKTQITPTAAQGLIDAGYLCRIVDAPE